MYKKNRMATTSIATNESREGETIEQKIDRIVNNGDPITDGAPIVYTERKDGVQPGYNPRTDRFEVALDAMDKMAADKRAKRENRIADREAEIRALNEKQKGGSETEGQSTQGSDGGSE